jgi:hypothetical protein
MPHAQKQNKDAPRSREACEAARQEALVKMRKNYTVGLTLTALGAIGAASALVFCTILFPATPILVTVFVFIASGVLGIIGWDHFVWNGMRNEYQAEKCKKEWLCCINPRAVDICPLPELFYASR